MSGKHRFKTGKFCMLFFGCLLIFSKSSFLKKNLSGMPSECQTVWIQVRPDVLSGLIWIQTVCIGYQQMTLVGKVLTHGPEVIKLFSCSTQLSTEFQLLIKTYFLKNRLFLLQTLKCLFIMLIIVKMQTIIGILTFKSIINFMLS